MTLGELKKFLDRNTGKKLLLLFTLFSLVSLHFITVSVSAANYTQDHECSVQLTRTDWFTPDDVAPCRIQKFDTSLGELQSIFVRVTGLINSEIGLENRDTAGQQISAHVSAVVTLYNPDLTPFIILLPETSVSNLFEPYDGINDHGGESGTTYSDISSTREETRQLSDQSSLDFFRSSSPSTSEFIDFQASATGDSDYSASANYSGYIDTFASVNVEVIYSYVSQDLAIQFLPRPDLQINSEGSLELIISNNESQPTEGEVLVQIILPPQITIPTNPVGDNWTVESINGNTLIIRINQPISSSSSVQLSIPIQYPPAPQEVNVTAQVQSQIFDPDNGNNSSGGSIEAFEPIVNVGPQVVPQSQPNTQTQPVGAVGQVLGVSETRQPQNNNTALRTGGGGVKPEIVYGGIFLIFCAGCLFVSFYLRESIKK